MDSGFFVLCLQIDFNSCEIKNKLNFSNCVFMPVNKSLRNMFPLHLLSEYILSRSYSGIACPFLFNFILFKSFIPKSLMPHISSCDAKAPYENVSVPSLFLLQVL